MSPLWLWWWVSWEWYLVKKFPCLTLCLYVYYIKYCIPSKVFEHLSKLWQFRDDGKVDEHHKIHFFVKFNQLYSDLLEFWKKDKRMVRLIPRFSNCYSRYLQSRNCKKDSWIIYLCTMMDKILLRSRIDPIERDPLRFIC